MAENYRIYCLDRGNHVMNVEWVSAATDDEAMKAARSLKVSGIREVWLGERLVGTITVDVVGGSAPGFWL